MTRIFILLCAAMAMIMAPVTQQAMAATEMQYQAEQVDTTVVPPVKERKTNFMSGFFDRFFKRIVGGGAEADPSDTMIAPFVSAADTPAMTVDAPNQMPVNSANLDQPHRSAADLAKWLDQALAESLSFTADNYPAHLKILERGYTPAAITEFDTWVTATGVLSALQTNRLQLNGFVSDPPFLLNEGALNGRYRWLYEIPVMVSFVPLGTTSYRAQNAIDTRRLIITLQVGRVTQSVLPDQVMIESWSVKDNTRRN